MPADPTEAARSAGSTEVLAGEAGGALVRRTVLPGGVRVLTEGVPGMRSASVGCWVGVGSRDEESGYHGATHFLEHLLFKGTTRRSALDIAAELDAVGGEANAVTGKEHTCYFARVLDSDLGLAVDVLTDMVTSALVLPDDVDSERGVILEELAMNDDDPSDVVHEKLVSLVLGQTPLGRPIGGTPETISAIDREQVYAHYRRHYVPNGLVFTAAGGVEHDAVVEQVTAELDRAGMTRTGDAAPLPRRAQLETAYGDGSHSLVVRRDIEQANVMLGTTGITATDERRFSMSVLNAILGGGMSSRLFQEVREKRGLAYSVYSFSQQYSDGGYFGVYAGCTPARTDDVLSLCRSEVERLAEDGIDDEELARGIGQLCGGLVLGLEDSGSRMSRLGKSELVYGEYLTVDDALARIRAVTRDDVSSLAHELAARPWSVVVVGPFDEDRDFSTVVA